MSAFHFLRPAWFLALLPLLALLVLLWRRRMQSRQWQGVVAPALLPHLLLEAGAPARRLPLALLGAGWLLAVTALAGPTWQQQPETVYRAPFDRVIVLDMSPSMVAADLKPDRLTRARYAIRKLLSGMREGRTALVVFSGEPHVVAPLTDDVATIEALLPALSVDIMPVPGNRAAPALRKAGELLQRVGSTRGEVLLLSDGVADTADSLNVVQSLRSRGIETSVLGTGTQQGAPVPVAGGGFEAGRNGAVGVNRLDAAGLRALASASGGRYQCLGDGRPLALLEDSAGHGIDRARAETGAGMTRWIEEGPWLLLPLLLIAAGGFRRGWLGVVALCMLSPPPAHAFGWQDLWLRPDQQASRLLAQGDAAAAAGRFDNPAWRATAQYRAGDYAAAAKGFAAQDSDGDYNRGNALARAGQLQAALGAYDDALKKNPDNRDAGFNRELVRKLLQQQQAQSGQPGQGRKQAKSGNGKDAPGASQQGQQGQQGQQAGTGAQSGKAAGTSGELQQNPSETGQGGERAGSGREQPKQTAQAGTRPDSAEQAREDVTGVAKPMPQPESGEPSASSAGATGGQGGGASASGNAAAHAPPSEEDLALQQWLRQVPDDPAGLLRRKFMLEHLLRQKGGQTP